MSLLKNDVWYQTNPDANIDGRPLCFPKIDYGKKAFNVREFYLGTNQEKK